MTVVVVKTKHLFKLGNYFQQKISDSISFDAYAISTNYISIFGFPFVTHYTANRFAHDTTNRFAHDTANRFAHYTANWISRGRAIYYAYYFAYYASSGVAYTVIFTFPAFIFHIPY